MMKAEHMEAIARKASLLAVSDMDVADMQYYPGNALQDCYEEYLDQLQNGDDQNLRYWIGWEIENGVREAVEIMKMWTRARLAASGRGGERR